MRVSAAVRGIGQSPSSGKHVSAMAVKVSQKGLNNGTTFNVMPGDNIEISDKNGNILLLEFSQLVKPINKAKKQIGK